jgi:hypothetical protein
MRPLSVLGFSGIQNGETRNGANRAGFCLQRVLADNTAEHLQPMKVYTQGRINATVTRQSRSYIPP